VTPRRPLWRRTLIAAFSAHGADRDACLAALEAVGALFLGGPLATGAADPAGVLAVLRTERVDEARRLAGGWTTDARPWTINEGRLALALTFSQARFEGLAERDVYLVRTRPANQALIQATLTAHLDYQFALEDRGQILAAGPLRDADGAGLIAYLASDEASAVALAEADPMHRSGARRWVMHRWRITHGSLTLRLSLSERRFALE